MTRLELARTFLFTRTTIWHVYQFHHTHHIKRLRQRVGVPWLLVLVGSDGLKPPTFTANSDALSIELTPKCCKLPFADYICLTAVSLLNLFVRVEGFEPPCDFSPAPKAGAIDQATRHSVKIKNPNISVRVASVLRSLYLVTNQNNPVYPADIGVVVDYVTTSFSFSFFCFS